MARRSNGTRTYCARVGQHPPGRTARSLGHNARSPGSEAAAPYVHPLAPARFSGSQARPIFRHRPSLDTAIRNPVIAVVAAVLLPTALILALGIGGTHRGTARRAAGTVSLATHAHNSGAQAANRRDPGVALTVGHPTATVPPSYLGISTEYWAMPLFERHMDAFERILGYLHGRADGTLLIRIGGDSADHAILDPEMTRLPNAVFELTPRWFRQTAKLVDDVDARAILDLNLVVDRPLMAALWARAAQTELPAGRIAGYEIGNEPDIYNPSYWSAVFQPVEDILQVTLFPHALTPTVYDDLYQRYAQVLAPLAAHVPLVAPAVAYPVVHQDWIRSFLASPHPGLGLVSAHKYTYSACAKPHSPGYPTVAKLLSERATAGMARSLRPVIQLVHRDGYPFELTELNSVTCGGVAGVSNTFATALWAPDALFELLRSGVNGVNVHVRAYTINAAFALARHSIVSRPLLYGLILFARTIGPHAQLLQTRERVRGTAQLKVWAVRVSGNELHVLLINKDRRSVKANLLLPSRRTATLQRLLAPGASAQNGVTLGGRWLGSDDRWHGRTLNETVLPGAHGYVLTVPAASAALLTIA